MVTPVWKMTLNSPWYELVRDGIKTYEGRCNWKTTKEYKIGDTLEISHHVDKTHPTYCVKIIDILHFKDFEEALQTLGLENTLPTIKTIDDGISIYHQYHKQSTQDTHGVCMIHVLKL